MASKILVTTFSLSDGTPATGITSSSIRIRDADSLEVLVDEEPLTEIGDGFYKYTLTDYSASINYVMRFDGGSSLGAGRYAYAANEHYSFENWEEPLSSHTGSVFASGSATALSSSGQIVNFIRDIEGGRWRIDTGNNQMIFYKDDNTTEVARYNLFDSGSNPDSINVFERRKV